VHTAGQIAPFNDSYCSLSHYNLHGGKGYRNNTFDIIIIIIIIIIIPPNKEVPVPSE